MIKHSINPHPPSYPFISGDTFRSIADHIYEIDFTFDPKSVAENDIVFVQSDILNKYFLDIHPLIDSQYKLITHNSDRNITDKELEMIDDKIIRWFAQNVLVTHPKITPIPIGLENLSYANAGYIPLYTKQSPQRPTRLPRILAAFSIASNPKDRSQAIAALSIDPKVDSLTNRLHQPAYISKVNNYCFVASPPGNGNDCIRTWEALYLGTIPIVKDSVAMRYFESIGLPIWIIDEWSDLKKLSEYDLQRKYDLIMSHTNMKPLHMDYWVNLINKYK